jgi:aspartate kinase
MGDSCTVLKFGGTSVEDVAAFARVTAILRARVAAHPVVVVSALARMTDALVASVDAGTTQELEPHFERHREIARRLLGAAAAARFNEDLTQARDDIARLLEAAAREPAQLPRLRDEVLSYGERLSSTLLAEGLAAAGLPATGVDARRCIVTDGAFGRATPILWKRTAAAARARAADQGGPYPRSAGYVAATASRVTRPWGAVGPTHGGARRSRP